jgi:hypothetical protein
MTAERTARTGKSRNALPLKAYFFSYDVHLDIDYKSRLIYKNRHPRS